MCRGPCIHVALRQVISELLAPLTGQFLVPHPSFHSTMGLFGALEWPSLGSPRGEKVWEAALRSRTSEPPRHSQSCRSSGRPMIPQPSRWNVVFAHPAFPQSVGPC